jgi:hypothetical protein
MSIIAVYAQWRVTKSIDRLSLVDAVVSIAATTFVFATLTRRAFAAIPTAQDVRGFDVLPIERAPPPPTSASSSP